MKRILALVLALMCAFSMIVVVSAVHTENASYKIPKTDKAPEIDGKLDEGIWDKALVRELNPDTTTNRTPEKGTECPDSKFYYLWDDEGIYLFAQVDDQTAPRSYHTQGAGAYNNFDGIQMNIYTAQMGMTPSKGYFWSLGIDTDGEPVCGEHMVFGGGTGADVLDVEVACTLDDSAYTIEAFFPKSVWETTKVSPQLTLKPGTTFFMTNIVMNDSTSAGSTALHHDSAFNIPTKISAYTLVEDADDDVKVDAIVMVDGTVAGKGYEFDFSKMKDSDIPALTPKNISNYKIENGVLKFTADSTDPTLTYSGDNFGLKADDIAEIRVKLKYEGTSNLLQIFFGATPAFNERASFKDTTVAPGEWIEVVIDPSLNTNWTGDINAFRVDAGNQPGNYEI